jgi:hypothetical protein
VEAGAATRSTTAVQQNGLVPEHASEEIKAKGLALEQGSEEMENDTGTFQHNGLAPEHASSDDEFWASMLHHLSEPIARNWTVFDTFWYQTPKHEIASSVRHRIDVAATAQVNQLILEGIIPLGDAEAFRESLVTEMTEEAIYRGITS